jgi:HNH endonuclease
MVNERDRYRCSYCLIAAELAYQTLSIDYILPIAKGGTNDKKNLCLSCSWCNSSKATKVNALDPVTNKRVQLFNPRKDSWSDHFEWAVDKVSIQGKTAIGRATVNALKMNRPEALPVRRNWVIAGRHPPLP